MNDHKKSYYLDSGEILNSLNRGSAMNKLRKNAFITAMVFLSYAGAVYAQDISFDTAGDKSVDLGIMVDSMKSATLPDFGGKNGDITISPYPARKANFDTVPAQRGGCTILYQSGTVDAFCNYPHSAKGKIRCYADVEQNGKQFRVTGDCYSSYGDCYFGGPGAVDHCDQRN